MRIDLAVDCDEVLVEINDKWTKLALQNKRIQDFIGRDKVNEFLSQNTNIRTPYLIIEWLGIHNEPELVQIFNDTYFNNPTFYDDLKPSKFAHSLLTTISASGIYNSVNVVTHSGSDEDLPANLSKKKFLLQLFKHLPIEIKFNLFIVNHNLKKSDVLNSIPNFNTFVDDAIHNIKDVITNCDSMNKEFLIPMYGYNLKFLEEASMFEKQHQVSISYFENF